MIEPDEVWKPVLGSEAFFEVSSLGRVRSLRCQHGLRPRPLVMKPSTNSHGYVRLMLRSGGSERTRFVHQLVLEAFKGPRPDGLVGRHLDGNKGNNADSNLAWGTQLENMADAMGHGSVVKGIDHHFTRLTPEQVLKIRSLPPPNTKIAEAFNITPSYVGQIKSRKSWKHLP